MATFSNKSSRMALRVQIGSTPEGDPILRTLSWSNINPAADADAVAAVSAALEALLDVSISETQRANTDLVI
ncbi:MAG TPA: DUF1659 domain-containing protein [Synergistaceae bacterium]|nr:DUF1659 domain-containing protein [Synergistaceae bacterium]HPJ26598.1 DUF1659 domain-containing protein [Synergistaceae bacterium]HPQ38358.1 DUF1659 domain-containing protein [Synergistaceae bacterium]